MEIEILSETALQQEHRPETLLNVLRQSFLSRNADFVVETSKYAWFENHAVTLRVGLLGLDMRADEAEALGRALIAAAEHYSNRPTRQNLDGPDAPFPGMAAAFEAHTGQGWSDRRWRAEAATWAAAWKAALVHTAKVKN